MMEESGESFPHDQIENYDKSEENLSKEVSLENKPNSISNTNSIKSTVIDSAKDSRSANKTKLSNSLTSVRSEFISTTKLTSPGESLHSKSKTASVNVSSIQNRSSVSNNNTMVSKKSSQTTRLESDMSPSQTTGLERDISHHESKEPSTDYNSWDKSTSRASFKTAPSEVSKKSGSILKNSSSKSIHSLVQENYISPWAKAPIASSKSSLSRLSTKVDEPEENSSLKCIPPWAKTMRKIYGMTCPDSRDDVSRKSLEEKIKGMMEKHSRLMLVKRGESRKQLILKPNECGDMGTVKMTSKNTRYYMTPIPKDSVDLVSGGNKTFMSSDSKSSVHHTQENDEMSVTKKTPKCQAKAEVSQVLKSLYNSKRPQREIDGDSHTSKNQFKNICPKITPSKIRDYVNAQTLDPDERQLHEIIKIKKVPSLGTLDGRKPSSKYIINVPKCTKGDGTTINKITVREKRKLRIHSVEDINENITEVIYNKSDLKTKDKELSHYEAEENFTHDVVPFSKRRKSPTKSRTLEVTAESPVISNLIKKEERDKDKILLIQYEKKSKPGKGTSDTEKPEVVSTQLLGVKQPYSENLKEMYLYGTETDGKKTKECATKIEDVPPTLREKVNMIFQELREMTFNKPCAESESPESDELPSSVSSKVVQYPSTFVETDAASVQALPEVRSVEIQVRESILISQSQSKAPHPTQTSAYVSEKYKQKSTDKEGDKLSDAVDESTKETESALETESKIRSQVEQEKETAIEEGLGEVLTADDTKLPKSDEGQVSQKSELSTEDIAKEETTELLEEAEEKDKDDKGDKDERQETVTSDFKTSKDDYQEDITSKDKLTEELEEKEKHETLTDEENLMSEERSLRKDTKEEEHLKESKDVEDFEEDKIQEQFKTEEGEGESTEITDAAFDVSEDKVHLFTEDIRSYDFDPSQEYQLKIVSSSKFFHQRDSIRRMNWSEDILYIENSVCPQLVKGLAEIAMKQPEDPISYLAHWIYKDYHNRESDEKKSIYKEHLEVAKDMQTEDKDKKLECKKFSIRRYPMKKDTVIESTKSVLSQVVEEAEPEELLQED